MIVVHLPGTGPIRDYRFRIALRRLFATEGLGALEAVAHELPRDLYSVGGGLLGRCVLAGFVRQHALVAAEGVRMATDTSERLDLEETRTLAVKAR